MLKTPYKHTEKIRIFKRRSKRARTPNRELQPAITEKYLFSPENKYFNL